MQNIIMIVLAALAVVLYFSPETLLSNPENDILKKIKDNSQVIALACAAGAGYLYYTSTQKPDTVEQSVESEFELPTYEEIESNTNSKE